MKYKIVPEIGDYVSYSGSRFDIYESKLLSMFSRYGFAQSPVSFDEIKSFFYNRISLDEAYAIACDVYCGIDDIETEENKNEML